MRTTRWLVGGIVAVMLMIGVTGAALVATGHGWFSIQSMTGYSGMMGDNGSVLPQGTPAIGVTQVTMTNHDTFGAAIIQVAVGTTVTWTNTDTDTHTVTFMPMMSGGSSNDVVAGATFSRTFTNTGTYSYRCMYHQSMVGEVIVIG